jgi:tetratricopeptide (TPR) repeat protein
LQYHLANAYVREQKLEAAVKHYQKAIALPIQDRLKLGAYNNLAGVFLSLQQWRLAEELYQFVLQMDPSFATAYYNLGLVYTHSGKLERGISAYQRAIELVPEYAEAHQNLGAAWLKYGNYTESAQAFQKAIALYKLKDPQRAQFLSEEIKSIGMQVSD